MPTDVRYFHSGMAGAPVLNNAAGALVAVLDACLITGFNTKTVTSVTVSSGIATVVVAGGHGFGTQAQYAEIAGATPSALNGEKKVLTTPDLNTFTFAAAGVSNGTATGTITMKRPPAPGWTKPYGNSTLGAYRSVHVQAQGFYLQVDDTVAGSSATVRGYEAMTAAADGTNPFPSAAQAAAPTWFRGANSSSARGWAVVCDGRRIWYFVENTNATYIPHYFGDMPPLRAGGDAFTCMLWAYPSNAWTTVSLITLPVLNSFGTFSSGWMARAWTGAIGAVRVSAPCGHTVLGPASVLGVGRIFPDPLQGGATVFRPLIATQEDVTESTMRAEYPGVVQTLNQIGAQIPHMGFLPMDDVARYPTGLLWVWTPSSVASGSGQNVSAGGGMLFDVDNDW